MSDDASLYTLFQAGKTVQLQKSENPNAAAWIGRTMRVIQADAYGVLASLSKVPGSTESQPVLFINFDGTTYFAFVPPGMATYDQVLPMTAVYDLESNSVDIMSNFFPAYFERTAAPTPPVPPGPPPAPSAQKPAIPPQEDWGRMFQQGTVYRVDESTDANIQRRYVGVHFQSVQADQKGVLGVPERSSGLTEAVYIPFDGATLLTQNPAGTFNFASGISAGQQVYSPATQNYVAVETFYPSVLDIALTAALVTAWSAPVMYYDTYVPYGVVYDPFYYDPYWYW